MEYAAFMQMARKKTYEAAKVRLDYYLENINVNQLVVKEYKAVCLGGGELFNTIDYRAATTKANYLVYTEFQ